MIEGAKTLGIGLLVVSACFALRWLMESLGGSEFIWAKIVWLLCWVAISFGIGVAIQWGLRYLPVLLKLTSGFDKIERLIGIFR